MTQRNPVGQSDLGVMYLHGKEVPKDTVKALKYITEAADKADTAKANPKTIPRAKRMTRTN